MHANHHDRENVNQNEGIPIFCRQFPRDYVESGKRSVQFQEFAPEHSTGEEWKEKGRQSRERVAR